MSERTSVYWDCSEDNERLTHETIEDALDAYGDSIHPAPTPESVEVFGFARMEIDLDFWSNDVLTRFIESVDEEYGDPDDGYSEPTEAMKTAAKAFVRAVVADYKSRVWACEIVETRTVTRADFPDAWDRWFPGASE